VRHGLAVLLALVVLSASGCDRSAAEKPLPPEESAPESPAPPTTRPALTPRPTRTASPTPTAFAETYVQPCAGRPSADQVAAVVRRQPNLLTSGQSVGVQIGPLCAGVWQYTVFTVANHEPLQVVTRGAPQALVFVTAGTDVCTVEVRANAPLAILNTANC
jgi:hypothetical protein